MHWTLTLGSTTGTQNGFSIVVDKVISWFLPPRRLYKICQKSFSHWDEGFWPFKTLYICSSTKLTISSAQRCWQSPKVASFSQDDSQV